MPLPDFIPTPGQLIQVCSARSDNFYDRYYTLVKSVKSVEPGIYEITIDPPADHPEYARLQFSKKGWLVFNEHDYPLEVFVLF